MNRNDNLPCQENEEELKKQKHRCWNPNCKSRAWLRDWGGWKWCLKDWYRSWRWGGGEISLRSFIFELSHTKIEL